MAKKHHGMGKPGGGHDTHKGMGKDPHASAAHHAMNKEHGTGNGCSPVQGADFDGTDGEGEAEGLEGGNATYHNE